MNKMTRLSPVDEKDLTYLCFNWSPIYSNYVSSNGIMHAYKVIDEENESWMLEGEDYFGNMCMVGFDTLEELSIYWMGDKE
jgi:hypothetical protein